MNEKKKPLIERIGSKLPEVNILFLYLIIITAVLSIFLSGDYVFEGVGEVTVNSVISQEGFRYVFSHLISNFITFAPLGIVLAIVIGTGVSEKTGLLGTLLKKMSLIVPDKFIIPSVIFIGVLSSVASDAGYIVLIPLSGALFAKLGKNPLIGMAAAFAGVSAGFGANLFPTPGDALLGAITIDQAHNAGIVFEKNVATMNYFFMIGSTFLLTIVGTFVTIKFIEPKFKDREFIVPEELKDSDMTKMSDAETKGLKKAGLGLVLVVIALIVLGLTWLAPYSADVTTCDTVSQVCSTKSKDYIPLLDNIIVVMIFVFLVPGYMYGKSTGVIKSSTDYVNMTVAAMKDMGYIVVLAFFAGNFIGIFGYTGIDKLIANGGAYFLIEAGLSDQPILLLVMFVFVTAFINLFIGSASAKWAILAPVFIPMLYSANPELTPDVVQVGYRVADSSTNIITPMMSYAGIVILYGKKYVKDFNYGTMVQMMYPYSGAFLVCWTLFLVLWISLGFPLGF